MPNRNQFCHQLYDGRCGEAERLRAGEPLQPDSEAFRYRMARVAAALHAAQVTGIFLIHGTFVGADASGALREVARVAPNLADTLQKLEKQIVDRVTRDAGNYTQPFAAAFEQGLQTAGAKRIPVKLFTWSGENHHIGRADGAVRLLHALSAASDGTPSRWLLWGHSHGGNVLALASNLLANDPATNRRFFDAARSYYRWPLLRKVDLPAWQSVADQLALPNRPWDRMQLDVVTFGTPVRYGWDTAGVSGLLHFVHHRTGELHGPFPPTIDDVRHAASGDLLQQLAVAGTNFPPTLWAWRARLADRRLSRLLQAKIRKRDLLERLRWGQRGHADGTNLLVDYGAIEGSLVEHIAGHAVYTRRRWLAFHAEETACRLYEMARQPDNAQ